MRNLHTFRRLYLDKMLTETEFYGKVLDIGGKKEKKRGTFRPPLEKVESWEYLNIDKTTKPDYVCSADAIPVHDNNFDVILITEVLEHCEDPVAVIVESYRVLKIGGRIVVTMPFLFPVHADPEDYQRWTPGKLRLELEGAGFDKCEIRNMGYVGGVISDLLFIASGTGSLEVRRSIGRRIFVRFCLPLLQRFFLWMERQEVFKNESITTGYFCSAIKKENTTKGIGKDAL